MPNYKGIAKQHLKNNYSKVVATGWRQGIVLEIDGFTLTQVLRTCAADGMSLENYAKLPYSVQRYDYTEWYVAEAHGVGLVLRHASAGYELIIYYNNNDDLRAFNESMITQGFWTARKRLKEKKHSITHN